MFFFAGAVYVMFVPYPRNQTRRSRVTGSETNKMSNEHEGVPGQMISHVRSLLSDIMKMI
jgi:hypothetical protein